MLGLRSATTVPPIQRLLHLLYASPKRKTVTIGPVAKFPISRIENALPDFEIFVPLFVKTMPMVSRFVLPVTVATSMTGDGSCNRLFLLAVVIFTKDAGEW